MEVFFQGMEQQIIYHHYITLTLIGNRLLITDDPAIVAALAEERHIYVQRTGPPANPTVS